MSKQGLVILLIAILVLSLFFSGCAGKDTKGNITKYMTFDGMERHYVIHIPPGYDRREPIPLVLVLHGGGGNPSNAEESTGMSDKADKEGFIVVYPAGNGILKDKLLTWNGGFCCGYALENNVDDVGFIEAVIDEMEREYNTDPKRVYATGISNGGIMSYRLAAELSDRIAAIAPVVASAGGIAEEGSLLWLPPAPDHPVSVIAFNGMMDGRIPYQGGQPALIGTKGAYSYISVNDSISIWVRNNGCSFTGVNDTGNIEVKRYTGRNNSSAVVLYTIKDGGHAWPGGSPGWIGGDEPTMDISANDLMWDFFMEHPKYDE